MEKKKKKCFFEEIMGSDMCFFSPNFSCENGNEDE